jgi:hypothetical protein
VFLPFLGARGLVGFLAIADKCLDVDWNANCIENPMGKALKWLRSHKIKKVGWPVDQGGPLTRVAR